MKLAIAYCLIATASAFAPMALNTRPSLQLRATTNKDEKKFSKRKIVANAAKRVAGALGTVALATSAFPSASLAKKVAAKEAVKLNPDVVKAIGVFAGGCVVAILGRTIFFRGPGKSKTAISKVESVFPGSLTNKDLVSKVQSALGKLDYSKGSTLLATSFGAEETNRALEKDFSETYDYNYHLGGLAGFPFGGISAFKSMASHIPDDGSCLVVFGPNVGVDSTGAVGSVELRGRASAGLSCGSAIAAAEYVASGEAAKDGPPTVPTDAQQSFLCNMLVPYAQRLEKASDKMVELPYVLYDAQKKMMMDIVKAGCGDVAGKGKIAVLGGIQVNTPAGTPDYYKPMSFEVYDNNGKLLEDLTDSL